MSISPVSATHAVAVIGVEGFIFDIEASAVRGTPGLHLYGLPDATSRETRDRVRAAIINAGLRWPSKQITVGLLPAALPKRGSAFDLAIAVAVLALSDAASPKPLATPLSKVAFVAELGLDGSLRPVPAMAPAAMAAANAGYSAIVVAHANAAEAGLLPELQVIAAGNLSEVIAWLTTGTPPPTALTPRPVTRPTPKAAFPDLADLQLSEAAVRALEVAAAGGHHLLITARRNPARYGRALPPLLPDLDPAAALQATAIHSVAGLLDPHEPLISRPPYRSPHCTSTPAVLCGGAGRSALPGEIALAHQGVLHLADPAGFPTGVLDRLHQPIHDREITVERGGSITRYPADLQLVVTSAACPCQATRQMTCACEPRQRDRYLDRLLGRLRHSIDLAVNLDDQPPGIPPNPLPRTTSTHVAARVTNARARASSRLTDTPWTKNGHIPAPQIHRRFTPSPTALRPLEGGVQTGVLSTRTVARIIRVAWTMSDLADLSEPGAEHIETALNLICPRHGIRTERL